MAIHSGTPVLRYLQTAAKDKCEAYQFGTTLKPTTVAALAMLTNPSSPNATNASIQFIDLGEEPGNRSRELAREIRTMHKEWEEDHILMRMPMHYDEEKWRKHITDDLHMPIRRQERLAPGRTAPKYPKNSLNYVRQEIASREPVPPHSF